MTPHEKVAFKIAGALVLLTVAFGAGRGSRPAEIQYKDKVVTHEVEKQTIEQKVDISAIMKQLQQITAKMDQLQQTMVKKNVSTTVDTEKRPDGTVITHAKTTDLTESNSSTKTSSETNTKTETSNEVASHFASELKLLRESLKMEEHFKTVVNTPPPTYRLGLNLGYDLASIWGRGHDFNVVPIHGMIIQLQLERRLFGPLFFVVWGQSTGVIGGGLNVQR